MTMRELVQQLNGMIAAEIISTETAVEILTENFRLTPLGARTTLVHPSMQ